jgi:CheY-like chemotaxis protein
MSQAPDSPRSKLVVVIDDDPAIREAMSGLLRIWGYRVVTAASEKAALALLAQQDQRPDLIMCDYGLAGGKVGVEAIKRLRDAFEIPALLITGEAAPAGSSEGCANRYHLMHKPADPTALQALLSQMFFKFDSEYCWVRVPALGR